jgi:hypothetical protein
MTIKINGTNTTAQPSITGTDTDTGLVYGTDEVSIVTGGTERAKFDSDGRLLVGLSSTSVDNNIVCEGNINGQGYEASIALRRGSAPQQAAGHGLGRISFGVNDNTEWADISAQTGGAHSATSTPSEIAINTIPAGSTTKRPVFYAESTGAISMPLQPIASVSDSRTINLTNVDLSSSNFYNVIHVNIGNHFVASTGRFTAPSAGVYRLYFRASTTTQCNVRLRKNGSTLNEAYDNSTASGTSVSSEAIVSMNTGDYLHIQVSTFAAIGGDQHKQITFQKLS